MTFAFGFLCGIWFCMIIAFVLGLVRHYSKPIKPTTLDYCIDCDDLIGDDYVNLENGKAHVLCFMIPNHKEYADG